MLQTKPDPLTITEKGQTLYLRPVRQLDDDKWQVAIRTIGKAWHKKITIGQLELLRQSKMSIMSQ